MSTPNKNDEMIRRIQRARDQLAEAQDTVLGLLTDMDPRKDFDAFADLSVAYRLTKSADEALESRQSETQEEATSRTAAFLSASAILPAVPVTA